jgi:hypothetical protein
LPHQEMRGLVVQRDQNQRVHKTHRGDPVVVERK